MSTPLPVQPESHLSSETIDLLLLSALPAPKASEAKEHLEHCARCKTRWLELNEDKQRFEQFVFARTLPKVEARVAAAQSNPLARFARSFLLPSLAVVAAAVAVVVAGPGTQTEDDVYVGVKGATPSFEVFAQRGEGSAFAVKDDTSLKPSDKIRFRVNPNGAKYVMVASTDAAGVFSVYHPFGAASSDELKSQAPHELPNSIELDATVGVERLIAVFSNTPVSAAQVEAALKANSESPKLPGVSFVTRQFRKVDP